MYGEKKVTMLGSGYEIKLEIDPQDGDYRDIKMNISLTVKDLAGGSTLKKQYIIGVIW